MASKGTRPSPHNCPIRERTADGATVGRCFFYCPGDVCPRHGDVSSELELYRETGKLSDEAANNTGDRSDPKTIAGDREEL